MHYNAQSQEDLKKIYDKMMGESSTDASIYTKQVLGNFSHFVIDNKYASSDNVYGWYSKYLYY